MSATASPLTQPAKPRPVWLPAELLLAAAAWPAPLGALQAVFEADFVQTPPSYNGLTVGHNPRLHPEYAVAQTLWHIISKDDFVFNPRLHRRVKQRVFDAVRAKKLPWCKPVIVQADAGNLSDVCIWEKLEAHGRTRIYCWLKVCDYLVILERYVNQQGGASLLLITAFYVDYAKKREELDLAYQHYLANNLNHLTHKKAPHNGALTPSTHGR
jgi:hypothetical protein